MKLSRRDYLKANLAVGLAMTLPALPSLAALQEQPLITRAISASGERLPIVGIGTNNFGVSSPEQIAPLREVVRLLVEQGASLIDTSRVYGRGRSEQVIGQILDELRNQDRVFITSKVRADSTEQANHELQASFTSLRTDHVPAMLVQSLGGVDVVLPVLREWKSAGKIRYIGGSTSSANQYDLLEKLIREERLDIIQIDYSVINRKAAERILPLAQDQGVAVLINRPLGGRDGNVLSKLAGKPLPGFAKEIGANSWAQLCLKYNLSHPAVTAVIPGVTKPAHLLDNIAAGRGELPDAGIRKQIESLFDQLG